MIFRQLFDGLSCTYTYILGNEETGEALIIDPVLEKTERYIQLLDELGLKLVKALDTHLHADHVTALGALRDRLGCITVMGRQSAVDMVSMRLDDGDVIELGDISLRALHTPGHTDDSYCYLMADRVFTGDTLLIRGTGRTDFQNGDPVAGYHSVFEKLLSLPGDTLVYPGHDYKGDTLSTIAEEKAHNPRLQVSGADEYAAIMDNLNLPNPKMMDLAVAANLTIGASVFDPMVEENTLCVAEARRCMEKDEALFIDLREAPERRKAGVIPGSLHAPYAELSGHIQPGGMLRELAAGNARTMILYCAHGERSALALRALKDAGMENVRHLGGGFDAWMRDGGPAAGR
ncbi:MAG TPA: MBL fold metallo-hydrolase [Alphaproteobacteria bacterium]|nr:MBL fold metallo-hydrolase [Alphaproteobacteria bacterium]